MNRQYKRRTNVLLKEINYLERIRQHEKCNDGVIYSTAVNKLFSFGSPEYMNSCKTIITTEYKQIFNFEPCTDD